MKHFVTVENLEPEDVLKLIKRAQYFEEGGKPEKFTKPVYGVNMFFENSTRTHTSFEMAERKLGMTILPFEPKTSSVNKGETLYDTLLTFDAIGIDIAVIRHAKNDYYRDLINIKDDQTLDIGIVNAGDGSGQHPSQSLLDMMTIYQQFSHFKGLEVAIVGDIKNSRVARSNMELLTKLGAKVYFSGPAYWYDSIFDQYGTYKPLDELIPEVDVLMLLRVQHERHAGDKNEASFSKEQYHQEFGLTVERYNKLKDQTIIMHPGPINRDVEFASQLVESDKSRFKKQMHNGVYMRMAMLEEVIKGRHLGGLK